MDRFAELRDDILRELQVDYEGLWVIPKNLRERYGINNPDEIRKCTLQIVEDLLSQPGVGFGQFKNRVFCPWKCTPQETITRIDNEWRALGRELNIADIGWLSLNEE